MKGKPDCLSCGACCVAFGEAEIWAEITLEDSERLGSSWCKKHVLGKPMIEVLAAVIDGRGSTFLGGIETKWKRAKTGPLKGFEVCACVALQGSLMNRVRCSVYEKRPNVCKTAMNPGEKACLEIRRAFLKSRTDGG